TEQVGDLRECGDACGCENDGYTGEGIRLAGGVVRQLPVEFCGDKAKLRKRLRLRGSLGGAVRLSPCEPHTPEASRKGRRPMDFRAWNSGVRTKSSRGFLRGSLEDSPRRSRS